MDKDAVYAWAKNHQRAISEQIERLELELDKYNSFLEIFDKFPAEAPTKEPHLDDERRSVSPEDGGGVSQKQFEQLARSYLIKAGRPQTGPQLVQAFREAGRPIGGVDEAKNIATKFSRAGDTFINKRGVGYWPSDVACPAIGYVPGHSLLEDAPTAPASSQAVQPASGNVGLMSPSVKVSLAEENDRSAEYDRLFDSRPNHLIGTKPAGPEPVRS
jgi:hypothetical protein